MIKINQVIIDVPFGDGEVTSYLDTSSGHLVMELGELPDADATVTTDYATAKAMLPTVPPGGNGMISLIGLSGNPAAVADSAAASSAAHKTPLEILLHLMVGLL